VGAAGDGGDAGLGGEAGASPGGAPGAGGGPNCPAGFEPRGVVCADIDECETGADDCINAAACVNLEGSFGCQCPVGQLGDARASGTGCLDVNGLLLWLDGADPFGDQNPPRSGRSMDVWIDRSGNGHHASQSVAARRPTYVPGGGGKGLLRFDGLAVPNGDELDIDNSGGEFDLADATIFTVLARRYEQATSNPGFFAVRSGPYTRISMHLAYHGVGWMIWNGAGLTYLTEPPFALGQLYLLEAMWDLGVETRRTNGLVLESITHPWNPAEVFRGVHIGWSGDAAEHFNGHVAEIIVFAGALAPGDRDAVADYLGEKWAIMLQ
jgi:hypothetical protein